MAPRIDVNRIESERYCQYFFEIFRLKIIEWIKLGKKFELLFSPALEIAAVKAAIASGRNLFVGSSACSFISASLSAVKEVTKASCWGLAKPVVEGDGASRKS